MEFIKLLPIFLALLALTQGGPISLRNSYHQRVLPEIPGYVPVYIQLGDQPPDVASLYQQARAAAHSDINNNGDEIMAADDATNLHAHRHHASDAPAVKVEPQPEKSDKVSSGVDPVQQ